MKNERWGELVGIRPVAVSADGAEVWLFCCTCGALREVEAERVRLGRVRHCSGPVHKRVYRPRKARARDSAQGDSRAPSDAGPS